MSKYKSPYFTLFSAVSDALETLENIIKGVEALMPAAAIGISCGGPLNEKTGVILSPPNLPGWDEVKIVEYLKDRFGGKVALQNDANACALAEWRFGAGVGTKNMVFLTFTAYVSDISTDIILSLMPQQYFASLLKIVLSFVA
mgnify:CR=1 FL=1